MHNFDWTIVHVDGAEYDTICQSLLEYDSFASIEEKLQVLSNYSVVWGGVLVLPASLLFAANLAALSASMAMVRSL